ncbi:hypothetical protein Tco_0921161 [Tanacetum coccineum]
MILLLLSVSIPPITGNFIIPCVVDGTAFIFRNPGLLMIPLNRDVDLTTMKSIYADVECSSSPTFTKSVICPNGHFISPLNPTSESISNDDPPSIHMRCTWCPPTSASIIRGPSSPSSFPKGGNDISRSGEKL